METENQKEEQLSERLSAVVRSWQFMKMKFMNNFSHIKLLEFNFGGRFDLQALQFGYKESHCLINVHYGRIKNKKYLHGHLFYGIIYFDKYW